MIASEKELYHYYVEEYPLDDLKKTRSKEK